MAEKAAKKEEIKKTWKNQSDLKIPDKSELFTSADKYVHKRGLKIGVYGPPESSKTYFCCTCPGDVMLLDTEFGSYPVAKKFKDKTINIADITVINQQTDDIDSNASIARAEIALKTIKDMQKGTVCIDSVSDIWSWMGSWLEETASLRSKKTGKMLQLEWGKANARYRNMIVKLLSKPVHVVLTAQQKSVYTSGGQATDMVEPSWQKLTPYWVDIVVRLEKTFSTSGTYYNGYIEKCRWERAFNAKLDDVSFQGVVDVLTDKLGVEIKI